MEKSILDAIDKRYRAPLEKIIKDEKLRLEKSNVQMVIGGGGVKKKADLDGIDLD